MRTEDARFSHINVDHNIEIAGIKLIDEDTGRIATDLVATMEDFAAAEVDPRFLEDIENLKLTTYGPEVTVGGTPMGLVANVDTLQQDLVDLRGTVESNFREIDLLKNTMVVDARVTDIEQNVQNNTETIGLFESQQGKLQANVDTLYALVDSLQARIDQLESKPTDPLDIRLFSVSNTQADFTITGGNPGANISVDINNVISETTYTNNYSFAVSPGVHYNVGFSQAGLSEELSLSFNAPGSAVVAILLDTVTSSSVTFKVEGPAPADHRGKDLVVSLKTGTTTVANKTLVHYTGAPTLSVFDNLAANTGYQLTVSETNTVLVSAEFTTTA
jgi:hypothetical protein